MDEVFPGRRLGSIVWRTRQGSNTDQQCFLSADHEHVLVYGHPGFSFNGFDKSYEMYSNTATDFSRNDTDMKGYDDCANQRLLSPEGRSQAQRVGQEIRRLKLPVGEVLASPVLAGSKRWLIGHDIPFRAVAGAPHLAEGEAVVIRPGGTHWTVVARLLPQDWAGLL